MNTNTKSTDDSVAITCKTELKLSVNESDQSVAAGRDAAINFDLCGKSTVGDAGVSLSTRQGMAEAGNSGVAFALGKGSFAKTNQGGVAFTLSSSPEKKGRSKASTGHHGVAFCTCNPNNFGFVRGGEGAILIIRYSLTNSDDPSIVVGQEKTFMHHVVVGENDSAGQLIQKGVWYTIEPAVDDSGKRTCSWIPVEQSVVDAASSPSISKTKSG